MSVGVLTAGGGVHRCASRMALAQLRRGGTAASVAAAGAAAAAAVLLTWPLAREARDHVLAAIYYWDAYTNTMIMGGRVDAALGRGALSLYDDYFFAPLPRSLVFNENLFGLSLIFAPFYALTGSPLLAYNLTLLSSLPPSGSPPASSSCTAQSRRRAGATSSVFGCVTCCRSGLAFTTRCS